MKNVENRNLTKEERAWAKLAAAILKNYVETGCDPLMEEEWFNDLCFMANVNPKDLLQKIEFIYGPWCPDDD